MGTKTTMNDLLKYYEAELALFNALAGDFCTRYPAVAGRLGISGEGCNDPHVERLVQACALLNARTAKRLDDSHVQFVESVLHNNFPHYLRPFPSCSIVHAVTDDPFDHTAVIPRGTVMSAAEHDGILCKFTTTDDLVLQPLRIDSVRLQSALEVPRSVRLPANAGPAISIALTASAACTDHALRLYINADAGLAAALRDALFLRTACALVESGDGPWSLLVQAPLLAVGLRPDQALLPTGNHPSPYRLLTEYFCFPEKFNFVDLDMHAIGAALPRDCRSFTLHLVLADANRDDTMARLKSLDARHLLTSCAPVVNLFRHPARPIELDHTCAEYSLTVENPRAHTFEIFSVDQVSMLRHDGARSRVADLHPLYAMRHGEAGGRYWTVRRDEALAISSPGHAMKIAFTDSAMQPLTATTAAHTAATTASASINLTCSNGEMPCRLPSGKTTGDLHHEGSASDVPVLLLRRPTRPRRFAINQSTQWRLVSLLNLNHQSLTRDGLPVLKEMLALHDLAASDVTQRQIDGITALQHRSASVWRSDSSGGSLVYGIDIMLTVDDHAFAGIGLSVFAQVIDHVLAMTVQFNSFTRLIVLSNSGKELLRCPPRSGHQALV
ncbi:UNVERIFIED_ORG: type VI secretion system protein ImpG [Zoogloea ramigera]